MASDFLLEDNGLFQRYRVPITEAEFLAVSLESRRDWLRSKAELEKMRALDDDSIIAVNLGLRFTNALDNQAGWLQRLVDEFGVDPTDMRAGRELTATEFADYLYAVYQYLYSAHRCLRIQQAFIEGLPDRQGAVRAGWKAVCDVCEDEPMMLLGGLMMMAVRFRRVRTTLPAAQFTGFLATEFTTDERYRLGRAVSREAEARQVEKLHQLLTELNTAAMLAMDGHEGIFGKSLTLKKVKREMAKLIEALGPDERRTRSRAPRPESLDIERKFSEQELARITVRDRVEGIADRASEGEFARIEVRDIVQRAGLGKKQKMLVDLLMEDCSEAEIAERLGKALGTVKATKKQARAKLRREAAS